MTRTVPDIESVQGVYTDCMVMDMSRTGQFIDPFGHRWALDQHLRDVPHDEVVRLAAEAVRTERQG